MIFWKGLVKIWFQQRNSGSYKMKREGSTETNRRATYKLDNLCSQLGSHQREPKSWKELKISGEVVEKKGAKRGADTLPPPLLTTKLRAKQPNKESEGRYWGIPAHYRHQGGRWDMGKCWDRTKYYFMCTVWICLSFVSKIYLMCPVESLSYTYLP